MIPLRDYRPSGITPYVNYALLALNVLVYLYQLALQGTPSDFRSGLHALSQNDVLILRFGVVPCKLWSHCPPGSTLATPVLGWLAVFTSMFLHGGLFHLGGNMLYLWIFGDNVEAAFGHLKYLVFYLLAGLAAALLQSGVDPLGTTPMIGASGAISGVLGAYLFMFPYARVLTLVPLFFFIQFIRLPALFVLGAWFVIQLISALGASGEGGVAFMAHVGGFLAGALLWRSFRRRPRIWLPPE